MGEAAEAILGIEPGAELVEPETILPHQFLERRAGALPELRLMAAILEDAVATYQRCANASRPREVALFRETAEWIEAEDSTWIFSFESICSTLALEPQAIRVALARWRDRTRGASPCDRYRSPFRRMSGSRSKVVPRSAA